MKDRRFWSRRSFNKEFIARKGPHRAHPIRLGPTGILPGPSPVGKQSETGTDQAADSQSAKKAKATVVVLGKVRIIVMSDNWPSPTAGQNFGGTNLFETPGSN